MGMLPGLLHVDDGFDVQPAETYRPIVTGVPPSGREHPPLPTYKWPPPLCVIRERSRTWIVSYRGRRRVTGCPALCRAAPHLCSLFYIPQIETMLRILIGSSFPKSHTTVGRTLFIRWGFYPMAVMKAGKAVVTGLC